MFRIIFLVSSLLISTLAFPAVEYKVFCADEDSEGADLSMIYNVDSNVLTVLSIAGRGDTSGWQFFFDDFSPSAIYPFSFTHPAKFRLGGMGIGVVAESFAIFLDTTHKKEVGIFFDMKLRDAIMAFQNNEEYQLWSTFGYYSGNEIYDVKAICRVSNI